MGKYIKVFDKTSDYEAFKGGKDWLTPNLCVIKENNCVNFQKYIKNNYLTMLALEDGFQAKLSGNTVEYKIDSGEWTSLASNTYTPTVNAGQRIYFKANLTPNGSGIGTFVTNKSYNLEGNCMSMLFGDEAEGKTDLTGKDYAFRYLFSGSTYLVEVERDFIPATTLANNCYYGMFEGCTSLVTAPELPATTLAKYCYSGMFWKCTSLVTAPTILPSTTLANSCYDSMFEGCISLVTAPELPATTLTDDCYNGMFDGCKSLVTAPELPATTLAPYCYSYMFRGCTSLVTAPELPSTTLASKCYSSMFSGTNVIPDYSNIDFTLSSVVQSGGLRGLFAGTKVTDEILNNILPKNNEGKYCLPSTTLADYCYESMFSGCESLVTAPELPATTLKNRCYQYMFHDCTSLVTAPELPATTLKNYCYESMFQGCTSLVTAPSILPATTLTENCYESMFSGCESLVTAPELPATSVYYHSYESMFYNCNKLNNITMLATYISASNSLKDWVYGVASSGTFTKAASMTSLPSGTSGIPHGWTVQDYNS